MINTVTLIPNPWAIPPTGAGAAQSFLQGQDWRDARTMQYCSIRDFSEGIWIIELRMGKYFETFRTLKLDNGQLIR